MKIHQVECNATLQVPMYAAEGDLIPDVVYSDAAQMRLRDCFIHGLVFLNASQEVALRIFAGHIFVVWIARGDLQCNVCGNDRWVITK